MLLNALCIFTLSGSLFEMEFFGGDKGCCVKALLAIMSCEKVTFGDLCSFTPYATMPQHSEQLTKAKVVYWDEADSNGKYMAKRNLWVTMANEWQKC